MPEKELRNHEKDLDDDFLIDMTVIAPAFAFSKDASQGMGAAVNVKQSKSLMILPKRRKFPDRLLHYIIKACAIYSISNHSGAV